MTEDTETAARTRILVVEDEHSIRDLVSEILHDEGYDVTEAANGAQALAAIDGGATFDLVVLDMWMPILNGWQFASGLGERGVELPIVVMTAAREARERALEIGAIGFIGKPFDVDAFVEAIREALDPPPSTPLSVLRSVYASTVRAARARSVGRLLGGGLPVVRWECGPTG